MLTTAGCNLYIRFDTAFMYKSSVIEFEGYLPPLLPYNKMLTPKTVEKDLKFM